MNRIARSLLTGLALAALLGCGAPPPEEQAGPPPEPGSQEAEETVFDDMIQTQDRARAVEGVLQDRKQDLDTAIDHADAAGEEE
jgi:hypothetical protein